jgi:hypothetical protein
MKRVECLGGGHPHRRILVAQRLLHGGHQRVHEAQHHLTRGGHHDLGEADADALPLVRLVGEEALLQDGDDLGEHALAQLPDKVAQRAGRHLPLVVAEGQKGSLKLEQEMKRRESSRFHLYTIQNYRETASQSKIFILS